MEEKRTQAKKGDIVKIHFTCKLEDGTVYGTSEGHEPFQFTIGEGEVLLPGLEEAVIGMKVDESQHVKVPSEKAFGPHMQEKVQTISKDQFPENVKPEVGLKFEIQPENGTKSTIIVTDVTESSVTLDANHPLAGKNLFFDIHLLEFERSVKYKAEEYYNQGVTFQDKGQYDEAISCYQKVTELNPGDARAYYNLGVAFHEKRQVDKAIFNYLAAIDRNLNYAEAYHNLGAAFKEIGNIDEAIQQYKMAIEINPNYDMAYYNLGNAFVIKGQFNEALQSYQKAVEIKQDYAEAHWNIALVNLLLGNFHEGWKGYAWRWELKDVMVKRNFSQPLWNGSDIKGRTILLYAEQGLGDTIQFIRYGLLVSQLGAKVILECRKELVSLLQNLEGVQQIVTYGEPLPDFDIQSPLLSLPSVFKTEGVTIPAHIPYVTADSNKVCEWRNKINTTTAKLRIGIAWAGDPELKDDRSRSCSLETFLPLAGFDGITFYSLQMGKASEQANNPPEGFKLIDYTEDIHDFSDTAAVIENLDLVLSVDTAVAHLAGALGKPVWILLPFIPDWRWMLNREDSPWYPTMRLFRQPSRGDWKSVIENVNKALTDFINKHHE